MNGWYLSCKILSVHFIIYPKILNYIVYVQKYVIDIIWWTSACNLIILFNTTLLTWCTLVASKWSRTPIIIIYYNFEWEHDRKYPFQNIIHKFIPPEKKYTGQKWRKNHLSLLSSVVIYNEVVMRWWILDTSALKYSSTNCHCKLIN